MWFARMPLSPAKYPWSPHQETLPVTLWAYHHRCLTCVTFHTARRCSSISQATSRAHPNNSLATAVMAISPLFVERNMSVRLVRMYLRPVRNFTYNRWKPSCRLSMLADTGCFYRQLYALSMAMHRRWLLSILVTPPSRTAEPPEWSLGTVPEYAIDWDALP